MNRCRILNKKMDIAMYEIIPNNKKTRSAMYKKEILLGRKCSHHVGGKTTEIILDILDLQNHKRESLEKMLLSLGWKPEKIINKMHNLTIDGLLKYGIENEVILNKEKCHNTNGSWFLGA